MSLLEHTPEPEGFILEYEEYRRSVLVPVRDEFRAIFGEWKDRQHWSGYRAKGLPTPSPIQRIIPRVKRIESVIDKIRRKPESYPDGESIESLRRMHDAFAQRIVVFFPSDLAIVHQEIMKMVDNGIWEFSDVDPPLAHFSRDLFFDLELPEVALDERRNGYASIHYIVRLTGARPDVEFNPWVEIQVRTLLEDAWAEVEHILGYKPDKNTQLDVLDQFRIIGQQLAAADQHFDYMKRELMRRQQEASAGEGTATLNAENLPSVMHRVGIDLAQLDIGGVLKILASNQIVTVGELVNLAKSANVKLVREVWFDETQKAPTNFDVIASLVRFRPSATNAEKRLHVIDQIALAEFWESRKPRGLPLSDGPSSGN